MSVLWVPTGLQEGFEVPEGHPVISIVCRCSDIWVCKAPQNIDIMFVSWFVWGAPNICRLVMCRHMTTRPAATWGCFRTCRGSALPMVTGSSLSELQASIHRSCRFGTLILLCSRLVLRPPLHDALEAAFAAEHAIRTIGTGQQWRLDDTNLVTFDFQHMAPPDMAACDEAKVVCTHSMWHVICIECQVS